MPGNLDMVYSLYWCQGNHDTCTDMHAALHCIRVFTTWDMPTFIGKIPVLLVTINS